jgi:hypothetical protein
LFAAARDQANPVPRNGNGQRRRIRSNHDRPEPRLEFELDELLEFEFEELLEFEFEELLELELDELLEFEFEELLEFEFDELLEFEFEELLEYEFEELLELEFEELLPANCSNFSSGILPVSGTSRARFVCVRMMLLIPPVSTAAGETAACEAPVVPVSAAKAKASALPIL